MVIIDIKSVQQILQKKLLLDISNVILKKTESFVIHLVLKKIISHLRFREIL